MAWFPTKKLVLISIAGIGLLALVIGFVVPLFDLTQDETGAGDPLYQPVGASIQPAPVSYKPETARALQKLTEDERSGGFRPGMGLAESSLLEQAGDLAGAVFAAFKEVFFAYQYGYLKASQVDERLAAVEGQFPANEAVKASLGACRALVAGDAERGLTQLRLINLDSYELDAFPRWMERVFILSAGKGAGNGAVSLNQKVWNEYLATRSRYINYPLYWLVVARKSGGSQRLDGAERVVSLAPQGPYAEEGRTIMALEVGLTKKDGAAIRTRMEIEAKIQTAIVDESGEGLRDLFPLLALPDNPYTLYALGALRGLAANDVFARFFEGEAKKSSGRLGERLRYVLGGRL